MILTSVTYQRNSVQKRKYKKFIHHTFIFLKINTTIDELLKKLQYSSAITAVKKRTSKKFPQYNNSMQIDKLFS